MLTQSDLKRKKSVRKREVRCPVTKYLLTIMVFAGLLLPGAAVAGDDEERPAEWLLSRYHFGARLGLWSNQGEAPPEIGTDQIFETNFNDQNFYFEISGARRIIPMTMLEMSLGIVNRGSVTFREEGRDNVGNVLVYAVLLQARFYPLAGSAWGLQPYVTAGGGLYYGRRSVQFTTDYYYSGLDEETGSDFSYTLGGGIDYPLAPAISLELNMKYMNIGFDDGLMTINNYDALAISIGAKYLYAPSRKEK